MWPAQASSLIRSWLRCLLESVTGKSANTSVWPAGSHRVFHLSLTPWMFPCHASCVNILKNSLLTFKLFYNQWKKPRSFPNDRGLIRLRQHLQLAKASCSHHRAADCRVLSRLCQGFGLERVDHSFRRHRIPEGNSVAVLAGEQRNLTWCRQAHLKSNHTHWMLDLCPGWFGSYHGPAGRVQSHQCVGRPKHKSATNSEVASRMNFLHAPGGLCRKPPKTECRCWS